MKKILILFALLFTVPAAAEKFVTAQCSAYWKYPVTVKADRGAADIMPDNGWYNAGWHGASRSEKNDGSWGINIEIQKGSLARDGYLFGAAFVPDANGEPTYRIFNGPIEHLRDDWKIGGDIAIFEGKMVKAQGGTCITCEHQAADQAVDAAEGNVKITWHDNRNATLEWAGKSTEISHWQWADNIGGDRADWVVGTWLAVGDYGYTRERGLGNRYNSQSGDRVRATSTATISVAAEIPSSLDGHGWSFYDIALELIRINKKDVFDPSYDPTAKNAGESLEADIGFILVYKPENDQFEIYLRHDRLTEFNEIGDSSFPVLRAFVKGQNQILAYGSHDPKNLETAETLDRSYLQLTRLPDGWGRVLLLPPAQNFRECQD